MVAFAYLLLAAAAVLLTLFAGGTSSALVAVRSAPETWALGALIHADPGHLARDVAGWAALGCLYGSRLKWSALFLLVILAAPTVVAFWAHPGMNRFFGLSGATHALFAAAFVVEAKHRSAVWWALTSCFVAKLGFELVTGDLLLPLASNLRPAVAAHISGACLGALWAFFLGEAARERPPLLPVASHREGWSQHVGRKSSALS